MEKALTFIAISGSLREKSRNTGLLRCALQQLPPQVNMTIADISQLPFYIEGGEKPEPAKTFIALAQTADAFVLACPEYNYSLAPALKNALDWLSREPQNSVLEGKPVAILGAGGGMGSSRSQYHLRQSCVCLGVHPLVRPEVFANAFSASFNDGGDVTDDALAQKVGELMQALANWTRKLQTA